MRKPRNDRIKRARAGALVLVLAACGGAPPAPRDEAGPPDAGAIDAGPPRAPDEDPPTITVLEPAADCLIGEVTFLLEAKDEGAGVGLVTATFAGRPLALEEEGAGRYVAVFDVTPLTTGVHVLELVAIDRANHVTTLSRPFGVLSEGEYLDQGGLVCGEPPPAPPVDVTPPEVTITSPPVASSAFAAESLAVSASVADDLGPVTAAATLDTARAPLAGLGAVRTGLLELAGVPEGVHELVVTAEDGAGNRASDARTVTVDRTPPVVTIVEPTAGASRMALTDVVAEASDENGVGRVLLFEVGAEAPLGIATAPGSAGRYGILYRLPCAGLPREVTFEMRALDAAGNAGSAFVTVTVTEEGCEP